MEDHQRSHSVELQTLSHHAQGEASRQSLDIHALPSFPPPTQDPSNSPHRRRRTNSFDERLVGEWVDVHPQNLSPPPRPRTGSIARRLRTPTAPGVPRARAATANVPRVTIPEKPGRPFEKFRQSMDRQRKSGERARTENQDTFDDLQLQLLFTSSSFPNTPQQERSASASEAHAEIHLSWRARLLQLRHYKREDWLRVAKREATYYRIHLFYFICVNLLGALIVYGIEGPRNLHFIDALFMSSSAVSDTGLSSVDFSGWKFGSQFVLMLLVSLGGQVIMTLPLVFTRLRRYRNFLATVKDGDVEFTMSDGTRVRVHPNSKHIVLQRTQLEYRALVKLAQVVIIYWAALMFGASLIAVIYLYARGLAYDTGVSAWWSGWFHTVSSFNNAGFSLFVDNYIHYSSDVFLQLLWSVCILAGNVGFPVFLRFIIWIVHRRVEGYTPEQKQVWKFIMKNPRRCFTHLFPSYPTWYLFWVLLGTTTLEIVLFLSLDWNTDALAGRSSGVKVVNAVFQSISTRTAGFNVVDLSKLKSAAWVLYTGLMYLSAYPNTVTMRGSNVSEVWISNQPKRSSLLGVAQRLVLLDILWIYFAFIIICMIEGGSLETDPDYSIFKVFFEIVSAYGTVGLTLGHPATVASFSGVWRGGSKFILCIIMLLGRHRGLPDSVDRAVLLPSDLLALQLTQRLESSMRAPGARSTFLSQSGSLAAGEGNTEKRATTMRDANNELTRSAPAAHMSSEPASEPATAPQPRHTPAPEALVKAVAKATHARRFSDSPLPSFSSHHPHSYGEPGKAHDVVHVHSSGFAHEPHHSHAHTTSSGEDIGGGGRTRSSQKKLEENPWKDDVLQSGFQVVDIKPKESAVAEAYPPLPLTPPSSPRLGRDPRPVADVLPLTPPSSPRLARGPVELADLDVPSASPPSSTSSSTSQTTTQLESQVAGHETGTIAETKTDTTTETKGEASGNAALEAESEGERARESEPQSAKESDSEEHAETVGEGEQK